MGQDPELAGPQAAVTDPNSPVKLRRKRTRTGCLKCRVRRRKCDERKPRCQRCVDGDFDCQYPSGLTFLEKNAITIPSTTSPTTGKPPAKYSRLQFLEPGASSSRSKKPSTTINLNQTTPSSPSEKSGEDGPDNTSRDWVGGLAPLLSDTTQHPTAEVLTPGKFINHHGEPMTWSPDAPLSALSPQGFDMHISPPSQLHPGATPSDGYETALHVLLSLGNESTDTTTGTSGPSSGGQDNPTEIGQNELQPDFSVITPATSYKNTPHTPGSTTAGLGSKDTIVRLLRHYRYEMAPWLDMCNMSQSFGLLVPRIALTSESVLHSLLELSAASLDAQSQSPSGNHTANEHGKVVIGSIVDSDSLVTASLVAVRTFITRPPATWESPCKGIKHSMLPEIYAIPALQDYIPSVFLRLELSAALVSGARVPLEKLQLVQSQWNDAVVADPIYQYACEPMMLCARAINFIAGDVSSPSTEFPIPLAQTWRHIAEELGAWYTNRPEEFQPIVELDLDSRLSGGERLFPTVLFTNGAAVLANQLYHTAMMILLQHKPRTLVLDSRRSSAVSPLWHAQRVCGIALNNDRRECWDLSLVSSLYLAAQKMTYEPQQREILRRFDAIARVTGWNIGQFSSMLREVWDISDKG